MEIYMRLKRSKALEALDKKEETFREYEKKLYLFLFPTLTKNKTV